MARLLLLALMVTACAAPKLDVPAWPVELLDAGEADSDGGPSDAGQADAGLDAGTPDGGVSDGGAPDAGSLADAGDDEWPNARSRANSDPWLVANHAKVRLLRPRVLVLNFVNAKPNAQAEPLIRNIFAAVREGTRYQGYQNPAAAPAVDYQLEKMVDLRDTPPPPNYTLRNSTKYPRESPKLGSWGFDYAKLFGSEFAGYYGYQDPSDGHALTLCELIERGTVHEVWMVVDGDVPDSSAAELLEYKPNYDAARVRQSGMDRCAGNGCFDYDDVLFIPAQCTRSVRVGTVNHARGVGCYLESLGHAFESMAQRMPYLAPYFVEFADFDLNARYGTAFASWYACRNNPCVTFTGQSSLTYDTGTYRGSLSNYVPACGNAHVPPNGRFQYDYDGQSPAVVGSTCEHYRRRDGPDGGDLAQPFSSSAYTRYNPVATDCGGAWHVYWRQNFPGHDSGLRRDDGTPMLSWWPFVYY